MNIFVDDLRKCPEGYVLFRTAEEFLSFLKNSINVEINILTLDHDLGVNVMDGYELTKNLYYHFPNIHIEEIRFHTDNFTGFRNMYLYMKNALENKAFSNLKKVSPYQYDVIDGEIIRSLKFT